MVGYMTSKYNRGDSYGSDGIAYSVTGPNSNSVATTALQHAGLPLPDGTGLNQKYPAPGSDVPLAPASDGTILHRDLGAAGNLFQRNLTAVENNIAALGSDLAHDLSAVTNFATSASQTIINRLRDGQSASTYTPVPGQSPVDQLRAHKAQAQNAPAHPLSPAMQARQAILRTLPTQMPSFAPIPGGGTYTPPPRGRAADLMMDSAGGANTLPRQLTAALEQAARAGTPLTPDDVQKLARQLSAANPQHPMLREVASGPALAAARQALIAAAGGTASAGTVSATALAPGARRFAAAARNAASQTGLSMDAGNAAASQNSSFETPATLAPTPLADTASEATGFAPLATAAGAARSQRAFEDAISAFFTRQARLPPNSGAAFDPLCTPAWPAWKFPL
jgi:hypothetical protein